MDLIDNKYIGLLSTRLQKFKKVKANLFNFRCPLCGDSQKNKNKTRGYIYQVKNNSNFNFLEIIELLYYYNYQMNM